LKGLNLKTNLKPFNNKWRIIMMRLCVSVYTLNNMSDIDKAISLLEESKKFLPEGIDMRVYRKNDGNIPKVLLDYVFGDLVQVIESPVTYPIPEFQDSDAFKEQQKATRGLFSNVTTTSYDI
jgi:hypothetical protein